MFADSECGRQAYALEVLLCLNKPKNVIHRKGRTIFWDIGGADYEGDLLLVDSGRRDSAIGDASHNATSRDLIEFRTSDL